MAGGHFGGGRGSVRMMNPGGGYGPPHQNQNFGPPPPQQKQQQQQHRGEMMNANGFPPRNPGPANGVVELKLIFNRDEMAYLFGFDGVLVAQLRQQVSKPDHFV
jgi:hypothetical protein